MTASPLNIVKERFGDKAKLVAEVKKLATKDLWLDRLDNDELAEISNSKLLKLHATLGQVKSEFGSRTKLIDAILELEKRSKDEGYKTRLQRYPTPRLLDYFKAANKRSKKSKAA